MYASRTWINDYLDADLSADAQADLLTRAGFPLEEREDVDCDGRPDVRQDFEMTSNRGDCTCHLGMAREIAAIGGHGLVPPAANPQPDPSAPDASTLASLENRDPIGCPRYTARIIRGVKVGPSPQWLADRLRWRGDIPRNNVVDATNFVLFEMGQPTHVFDLAKLAGPSIIVRRAAAGETLLPLGEGATPITLDADDLVIADAERPVALAGVKGGAPASVTEDTVDLLIEAATFDPVAVRTSSRRHVISSDSSYRFERGVHPAAIDAATDRLVALILEIAGGQLSPGTLDAGSPIPAPRTVSMRPARARRLLGLDIDDPTMAGMLERLGFAPATSGDTLTCTVPVHRLDIEREVDLIEEVARMHGLDSIPVADRLPVRVNAVQPEEAARRAVADCLVGAGFIETVTHSLVSEAAAAAFLPPGMGGLRVNDERAGAEPMLRPSVLPSLARVAARNRDHGGRDVRVFEQAATFALTTPDPDGPHMETINLGLLHEASDDENPLRETRGIVDRLAGLLLGPDAAVRVEPLAEADGITWLSPGASVLLGDERLGVIGALSPAAAAATGLEGTWMAAELGLPKLYAGYPPERTAESLPSFPAIERDLTLLVPDAVRWNDLEAAVRRPAADDLDAVEFVGTYRGKGVPDGSRSLTLRLRFRRDDRTLTHDEVDPRVEAIVQSLAAIQAEVRA
ncbi:MAG: phenylalanine--tRNA ligase subunit beta [Phycisphaerales bacterium]